MGFEFDMEILNCFLDEANDTLANFERACLDLEVQPSKEAYEALFRSAHNLKGASRAVGLENFGEFIHRVEDIIHLLMKEGMPLTPEIIALFLEAQVTLVHWIEGLRQNAAFVPDIAGLRARVIEVATKKATPAPIAAPASPPSEEDELEALFKAAKAEAEAGPTVVVPVTKSIQPKATQATSAKQGGPNKAEETLRIAASKLDELIQLIGELSIHQAIITESRKTDNLDSRASQHAIDLSARITKDLHTKALSLRMQPLQGLFQRLERTARDVARAQSKTVTIELQGIDVELDKSVIERITDPLVHMIRNSVDHGIESKEQRRAVGKPEAGVIQLTATQEASGIVLRIIDDGRGLNKERIYKKAVERGLLAEGEEISDDKIYRMIFAPGFSTAEVVTDISGRGVGMDVVSRAVNDLRGTIDLKSTPGKGTTFAVTLPTSLSIVDALVVKVSEARYAIPMQELEEIIDLENFKMEKSGKKGRMISLRGTVIPVEQLREYMPLKPNLGPTKTVEVAGRKGREPALVVKQGEDLVAFTIDQILAQQQVVVRPISEKLKGLPGFSGCTILGDGEPGVIVSLPDIARRYLSQTRKVETRV